MLHLKSEWLQPIIIIVLIGKLGLSYFGIM